MNSESAAKASAGQMRQAELLQVINEAWANLNALLDTLTLEDMSEVRDAGGWAAKEHLIHLMAWERSGVAFLQGTPRSEGLGIDKTLLLSGDFDKMNSVIQELWKDLSAAEARIALNDVHAQMLRLIESLGDKDLTEAMGEFAPSASGRYDKRPIQLLIYGDTAEHFQEHQVWLEEMFSKTQREE
jgi:hypothetical protein